jgi:hypothetical protein
MNINPEIEFHDNHIDELSAEALLPFSDGNGCFTKSFDVTLCGIPELSETFILSSTAKYECQDGKFPLAQARLIDKNGHCLYYSPIYEIGHAREFYRREWRIPAAYSRYNILRISFVIPEGTRLYIRDIRLKHNYGYRERDFGIRYHGHGGCTTAFGFQMTAELGYTSCITIPKFTKDGVPVCFHDDDSLIKELRYDDGSLLEPGGKYDRPISEFTYAELCELSAQNIKSDVFSGTRIPTMDEYFKICSSTGMQPIFSVHPALTKEEWMRVRELLIKYRLLEHFWVKSNQAITHKTCLEVFGTDIAGYILIQGILHGVRDTWDPAEMAKDIGLDIKRHNVVMEYFFSLVTEEKIKTAKDEGFNVSIAAMRGGVSGPCMQHLIDLGVTEFTLDHHCSMGLSW